MATTDVHLCNFDHNALGGDGLRGEALDRHVLMHATSVSSFWITETQAREVRIHRWEKRKELVLKPEGYPRNEVLYFIPRDATLEELASIPPSRWHYMMAPHEKDLAGARDRCRQLEYVGVRLLLVARYLEVRSGADGCGLKKHEDAAQQVRKLHKRLRTALGYTIPGAGLLAL